MGTTLDNGIYLPDKGERNCYEGLAGNWVALDNHLGSTNIHVTINDKQAWNGHVADTTIHVTSADKQAWNGKADASALTAHTGDTTIHVTAEDKAAWNGKADASALTAHTGDNTIHVTAEDKAKWDAVTGKANDADVVHKSGNETTSGIKTFSSRAVFSTTSKDGELTLRQNAYDPSTNGQSALSSTCGFTVTARTVTNGSFAQIGFYGAPGFTTTRLNCRYYTGAGESEESWVEYTVVGISGSITGRSFKPSNNGSIDLGTNTNRWKSVYSTSINGLEPSSLSLPSDRSARIDISSYFTNTGTGQSNSYTVPANGYIYLTLSELTNVHCFSRSSGNVTNYAQTFTKVNNSTGALYVLFPVRKNDVFVATWYTTTTVSVDGAFFIPCQGNI